MLLDRVLPCSEWICKKGQKIRHHHYITLLLLVVWKTARARQKWAVTYTTDWVSGRIVDPSNILALYPHLLVRFRKLCCI
jgi:hypothetical protein